MIQESQSFNILLLGGNGFLGNGLQKEFQNRQIRFKSIDIEDYDLADLDTRQINELALLMKDYTHIVLLASKLGVDIFNDVSTAFPNALANSRISYNVYNAMLQSANKYRAEFDYTYYSSSELFWTLNSIDEVITDSTKYNVPNRYARSVYAIVKKNAERVALEDQAEYKHLSAVKIIRPFNISGRGQKRGVMFDMVKSALEKGVIRYAKDTTRTITDIDIASRQSADVILSKYNIKKNIADERCSLTMKVLAEAVNKHFNGECKLQEMPQDQYIPYRHVSKVHEQLDDELYELLEKPIKEIEDDQF